MSFWFLVLLAIIQGITEFIPVSSSAHLILLPTFLSGAEDQGPLIDVAAHVGTLGAVMAYFRKEVMSMAIGGVDVVRQRRSDERQLFEYLAIATIPLVAGGAVLYLSGMIDRLRDPMVLGLACIGFGVLLWWSDRFPVTRADAGWTWPDVLKVGLAQALALIPGASRSGVTITAARFLGVSRHEAARFSMLLSIPAIMILGAVATIELARGQTSASVTDGAIVAGLSFLFAMAAIHLFLEMTRRMSFTPFVIYRLLLGAGLIAFALTRTG